MNALRSTWADLKDSSTSLDARSANLFTDTIQAIDPELTENEQKKLDKMVDTDLEFWKEENGRSEKVVQGLVSNSD